MKIEDKKIQADLDIIEALIKGKEYNKMEEFVRERLWFANAQLDFEYDKRKKLLEENEKAIIGKTSFKDAGKILTESLESINNVFDENYQPNTLARIRSKFAKKIGFNIAAVRIPKSVKRIENKISNVIFKER